MEGYHRSVLLKEAIEALKVVGDRWYLDTTLGDGGHTVEILKRGGKVLGIDVDPQALQRVKIRLKGLGIDENRFKLVQGNFRDIKNLLEPAELTGQKFVGAIFDLGVSSLQLQTPERGFSFMYEGSLDMRMDPTLQVKALDLVNVLNKGELYELFTKLGEEKFAKALSAAIISARQIRQIKTTKDLAEIAEKSLGRRGKMHPATKAFQALRIAVNDELNVLQEGLDEVKDLVEGRIVLISFHSLEDRIVKNTFLRWQDQNLGHILTDKPITPSEEELKSNPRSRSAKMRIFEL